MANEISNGEYKVVDKGHIAWVYKNGESLGYFWEDKRSEGYAVFRHGNSKPIARPKSPRGCVLKLTNGEWDGKPEDPATEKG